jgi:hypothetical protein
MPLVTGHRFPVARLVGRRGAFPSILRDWHVGVYQGWNGALRTGVVGAFFTLVVGIFNSLWPAIALHALVDLGAGMMAWLALREDKQHAT